MTFSDLIQVVAVSSLLTFALILMLSRFGRALMGYVERQLPPRYLKKRRVRRRVVSRHDPS